MNKKITPYILLFLTALLLFSCKSAKLSDAEEKQRIGEYFEAAAIYRKVYTKTSPQKRDLRGYIAYRMAECNRLINNTPRATSAYMNALRYDYPDSIVSLRLGQMRKIYGRHTPLQRLPVIKPGKPTGPQRYQRKRTGPAMETKPEPLYR